MNTGRPKTEDTTPEIENIVQQPVPELPKEQEEEVKTAETASEADSAGDTTTEGDSATEEETKSEEDESTTSSAEVCGKSFVSK